nr:cadherin-like beta sandwich domain-containing protein [Saccharibacillus sp. JS10]
MLRQNLEGASTETPSTLVAYDDGYFYEEVITNKTGTKLKAAAAHNSIAVAVGVNGAIFVRGVFPSEENDVTSLTLTNATLEPEFDSNIITYHATPIANATSVGVEVNVSKYATFTINGVPAENGVSVPVPLTNPGQIGNVEIVVTPQYGGVTKTYKISIAADRTAQLTSLAISQGILEPQFSSTVFSYYAQVESDIDKLNLTAIKRDVNATMTIASNGGTPQPLTSDTPISLALQEGWNGFQIVVTSPTDTKTYTVSVTRFYSADLSNLTVNPGTLVPAFDPKRTDYTVSVANSVSTIAVTPTAKSKSAAIMVNGRETVSGEVYNMPLQEGRNEVKIVVTNQTFNPTSIENVISTQALPKTEKVYTVIVNRAGTETSNPTPTPSNPVPTTPAPVTPAPTTPTTPANGLEVLVNGQPTTVVATGGPSQVNGQTVFNATIDTTRLTTFLASTQGNPTVTIPVRVESDRILANMTAEAAALLISRNATLRVESPLGNYTLPSSQIRLGTVANTLGVAPGSASLNLNVVIEKSNTQVQNALNQAVANGGFTIASQPIDFMITASVGDRTVEVNSFTQYVEREIPLPTGTNSNQVTTAVVIEQNGTLRHVPTEVTRSGDNDYARVNSLTNSSYALIWNPKQFSDVAGKWSQASVNDMASRLIVNGVGGDRYNPEGAVTRAEFSAILVRALGLPTSTQSNTFSDVSSSDWYAGAASTANAYGLITGYPDGTFRPNATITRQEAFAILDRATQIVPLQSSDNATELSSYRDQANVASWARTSTQAILAAGLAEGNSGWLRPEATLSRAESAAVAQRLLQQSNLID